MRNPFMGTVVLFNSLERKIYSPHSRNLTGPVPSCRYSSEPEISTHRAAGGDAFSFSNSAIQHLRSRDSKREKDNLLPLFCPRFHRTSIVPLETMRLEALALIGFMELLNNFFFCKYFVTDGNSDTTGRRMRVSWNLGQANRS